MAARQIAQRNTSARRDIQSAAEHGSNAGRAVNALSRMIRLRNGGTGSMANMDFAPLVVLDQATIDRSIKQIDENFKKLIALGQSREISKALQRASAPMLQTAIANALSKHRGVRKLNFGGKYKKQVNMMLKIARSMKSYIATKGRRSKTYHKVRVAINRHSPYMREFIYIAKTARSKYKGGRTFIPAAIEYGHIAPNGTQVPAMPYMRPAIAKCQQEVTYAFSDELKVLMLKTLSSQKILSKAA
jgi:hypothetical protein